MKKLLLFSILVLSMVSAAFAQDILNLRMDCNQLGLRGSVALVDEDLLIRKDYFREDWPARKWFRSDLRQFLQEETGHIYTFRPNGRLASVVYTYKGNEGKRTNCTYASNGLLTSFVGEGYRVSATYKGNTADINIYAETPSYSPKVDLDHADLSKTPYTKVYPFDMTCRQQLSDDGLVLKSSYYYVDSMPARTCSYLYSHRGQVVEEKLVDYTRESDGSDVTITTYTYDGDGYLVMKKIRGVAYDETYTYLNNEYGDCVEMTIVRPYGTVVYTYDYEYDNMDNWTMRLCYKDGVFDNAVLRRIDYLKGAAQKPAQNEEYYYEVEEENHDASVAETSQRPGFFQRIFKKSDKVSQDKSSATPKAKADKPKKAKTDKSDNPKKVKADKPKKAKADKSDNPKKVKADKPKKAKADKADKPKKVKADKPKKAKADKSDNPKKVKADKPKKAKADKSDNPKKVKADKPKKAKANKADKPKKVKADKPKKAKADKSDNPKKVKADKPKKAKADKADKPKKSKADKPKKVKESKADKKDKSDRPKKEKEPKIK